jgi:phage-related baseplate assembly protein
MSLNDLPDIQLVDTDPETIRNNIITTYEAISGRKLYPGDPVRLFLSAIAGLIVQQRVLINDAAKQNLLRYARGKMLDHLGARVETPRLPASAARTTIRFTLSTPRIEAVAIPAGTRVSPGGNIFFATTDVAEIAPGEVSVDVAAECTESGTAGNGFLPGQINLLVDSIPFVASVVNTTESSGGADREDDDAYRERIYTAPERFSVAGPRGAYEYWARTANAGIGDVHVHSPAPSEVEIRVLMADGELPSSDVLQQVADVLRDDRVRPLTDRVTVLAPGVQTYAVDLTYWIDTANAPSATTIQTAVDQAVAEYVLWQKSRIGRNVNPSELIRRVMQAGARRVAVTSPTYTVIDDTDIAVAENVNVVYGGLESD